MNVTVNSEPTNLWRTSVVIFGLITAQIIIKHRFLRGSPLGTDPCDAVNAFAFITIAFIAIGSLFRISRYRPSPALQHLYVVRSQQAVLFAIFITLMAEAIALGRHPAMWVSVVSPIYLFALLGLAVVTVATQLLILITQRNKLSLSSLRWTRTVLPTVVAIGVLIVCPEWPIYSRSTTAHILTVAVGALVVFVPMRLLLPELVLNGSDEHGKTPIFGTREWILLAAGVVVVLFGFWPDATKANRPMGHMHLPIVVAEIAELFIAYALLGASLGFGRSLNNAMQSQHANK